MRNSRSEQSSCGFWRSRVNVIHFVMFLLVMILSFPLAAFAVRAHYARGIAPPSGEGRKV